MNNYKRDIEKLNNELNQLRRKLFEQKKKEVLEREKGLNWLSEKGLMHLMESEENTTSKSITLNSKVHKVRFVGGGFAVK